VKEALSGDCRSLTTERCVEERPDSEQKCEGGKAAICSPVSQAKQDTYSLRQTPPEY